MPRSIERRRSPIHGNGVFATRAIASGERIIRYQGLARTHVEVDRDYAELDESGHTFLFRLNDAWVVDANFNGNLARWINHSCAPNCEAELVSNARGERQKDQVFIVAVRAIATGEELCYNYGIVLERPHTAALKRLWPCRCGSERCTGTLLQPKKKASAQVRDARAPAAAKTTAAPTAPAIPCRQR